MDDLKQGIRLRAYANTDPVIAYKQESLTMFERWSPPSRPRRSAASTPSG